MHELQTYRWVISNETGEWWKIWRGVDLSFQNWQKEFDEFWLQDSKVLKVYILMGCFWPNYIIFELEKPRGVMFNCNQDWYKVEGKLAHVSKNWHEEFANFHQRMLDCLKIGTLMGTFYPK